MTAGWVAATTRGRALVDRLLGPGATHELATMASWPEARRALAATIYGSDLPADADRFTASRVAVEATTWQLRVLAGWLPPGQNGVARLAIAPMEIANIEAHLARLDGTRTAPSIPLGSLAGVWPRVAATTSAGQVRGVLAHSVWGDPGSSERTAVAFGLRVGAARRLASLLPEMSAWANGAATVLAAREQYAFDRAINEHSGRTLDRLLGPRWRRAATVGDLADGLPRSAAWALEGVTDPSSLWRAELNVARRVADDAHRLVSTGRHRRSAVAALMALMLVDLWRVRAAIEVAGRTPTPEEVFDAVA